MGLLDAAEDLGGAIANKVQSFGDSVGSAASFAKDIGAKTVDAGIGVVKEVGGDVVDAAHDLGGHAFDAATGAIGTVGRSALEFGSGIVDKGLGLAKAGIGAFAGFVSDPGAAISGIVASGRALISSALGTARTAISGFVSTAESEIGTLIGAAGTQINQLGRTVAAGVGSIAQAAGQRYLTIVHAIVQRGQGLARSWGSLAKLGADKYTGILRSGILMGATAIRDASIVASAYARMAVQKASAQAVKNAQFIAATVKRKINFAAQRAASRASFAAQGVTKAALTAQQIVNRTIGTIAPHLPGPLRSLANQGQGLANSYLGTVMGLAGNASMLVSAVASKAASGVDQRIDAGLGTVTSGIEIAERGLNLDIMNAQRNAYDLYYKGIRVSSKLSAYDQAFDQHVDHTIGWASSQIEKPEQIAQQVVPKVVGTISAGAQSVEAKREQIVGKAAGLAARGFHAAQAGAHTIAEGAKTAGQNALAFGQKVVHGVGEFASAAVDRGLAFGAGVLDHATKFSQAKEPNDGDLTGPFFPGDPMAEASKVSGFHGSGSPATRERAVASGANIFVNGIDTTLADHCRAAQRLANALNTTVVGVYNATGGMKADLIQCASDKMFDRSGNPAVATMTRLIRTYGDARKPQGGMQIFAHSQGSLIVSEALRQAKTAGADLRQNEVTTFGNAAFTYPAGPKYHHYIHDDDAVAMSVGTGSVISNLMNNTGVGKSLTQRLMGPTADVQASTVTLHHGGSGIDPHAINAPGGHDYIGDLPAFRAQEQKQLPVAQATPVWQRSMEASSFALARAAGNAGAGAVSSGYGAIDSGIRSLPSIPGLPANSIWGAADRGLRSFGGSMLGMGSRWGAANDASFSQLSTVQRSAYTPAKTRDEEHRVVAGLAAKGDAGFAPDTNVREKLAPHLGYDPSMARLHDNPASASAAQALGAHAFTVGQDVHFAAGEYDPHSAPGLALIGHELTHVAQQASGIPRPLNFSRDIGSTGDLMEAEAQTVAARILSDVGSRDGLHVDRFYKVYEAAEGLGNDDSRRLDRIGDMAIRKATEMLGRKSGIIEQITVSLELDLGRMNDDEAAGIWAEAIVAQVNLAQLKPPAVVPAPNRVQKDDKAPAQKERHLPKDVETSIEEDARMVQTELDAFWGADWKKIIDAFSRWHMLDFDTRDKYDDPTKHMDYFLVRLQILSLDKGYIAAQYTTVLDDLLRRDEWFNRYLKDTKDYSNYKAAKLGEGAGSYVGKHVLMGVLGILKALGGALMGLGQAALWAEWKASSWKRKALAYGLEQVGKATKTDVKEYVELFRSDDPPKADDFVAKCFDDTAKIIIDAIASDEWGPGEKQKLFEDFSFGNKWGAIPANLMMLGAGGGGLTSKGAQALFKGLMVLSTLKGIDDASKALFARVEELKKKNPNATWWDILSDGEVLKQFTTIIVSAISLGTNMSEATDKAKGLLSMLQKIGYAGDWAQLAPILKKAWDDYHDPALDDKAKKDKLEQDAVDFINQVINVGNSTKNKIEEARKPLVEHEQQQRDVQQRDSAVKAQMEAEAKAAAVAKAARAGKEAVETPGQAVKKTIDDLNKPKTPEEIKRQEEIDKAYAERDKQLAEENRKASAEGEAAVPGEEHKTVGPTVDERAVAAQAKRAKLEKEIATLQENIANETVEPDVLAKRKANLEKKRRQLAETSAPGLGTQSTEQVEAIAKGDQAKALQVILAEKSWKGKVREAVSGQGEFGQEVKAAVQAEILKENPSLQEGTDA